MLEKKYKKCKDCGFEGEENFFVKKCNWCKKCKTIAMKKLYHKNKNIIKNKTCISCGFEGQSDKFLNSRNLCRVCGNKENRKLKKENRIKNNEKIKKYEKEYIRKNKKRISEKRKIRYNIKKNKITIKICNQCGFEGESNLFIVNKNECKKCHKKYKKKYIEDKRKIFINFPEKQKTCTKCNFTGHHSLFCNDKNLCKKCHKKYKKSRKEFLKNYNKKYNKEKKQDVLKQRRIRMKWRRKYDPIFKLKNILHSRAKRLIKNKNTTKLFQKRIGCTSNELKLYIESLFISGMTWLNWGLKNKDENGYYWEIDHIIPFYKINLLNDEELNKVCHFLNLRPCWGWANGARNFHKDEEIDFNSPIPKYFIKEKKDE